MDFSDVQLTPNEAQLASWCKEAYKNRKKEATQISSLPPSPRLAIKGNMQVNVDNEIIVNVKKSFLFNWVILHMHTAIC